MQRILNRQWVWLGILPLLAAAGCKRDPDPEKVYQVPALIQPYIDAFEQEAALRGVTLEIDNLIVEFESNLQGGDAAGLCTFASPSNPTPHVRLDTTSFNWRNNAYHREILVFHELGHCILNRLHRDDKLPNGNAASIMRATGEQLYGGTLNAFKRAYYLDELFDESTPAPDWAVNVPAYASVDPGSKTDLFIEHFANNFNNWPTGSSANTTSQISGGSYFFESKTSSAYFVSKPIALDESRNFEIEASIKVESGTNPGMLQWGGSSSSDLSFLGFTRDSTVLLGNWTTGISTSFTSPAVRRNDFNKLTVRKQGSTYYLYLNEQFIDVLEYAPLPGDLFAFYTGAQTAIRIDYLFVRYLP
jgi:hypothetical protein